VLNYIWLALVLLASQLAAWNDRLKDVTGGALDGAKTAVTIRVGMIGDHGIGGMMRLAERAGCATDRVRMRPFDAAIVPEFRLIIRDGSMLMEHGVRTCSGR